MYTVEATTQEHIEELAVTMREEDKQEVWAMSHSSPLESLNNSVEISAEPLTGLVDGKVICIFGVVEPSILSTTGIPWLLGSDLVADHSKIFLKMNKVFIDTIKQRYSLLTNYVDNRNKVSMAWLRWLGFKLHKPAPYGPDRMLFRKFEFRS